MNLKKSVQKREEDLFAKFASLLSRKSKLSKDKKQLLKTHRDIVKQVSKSLSRPKLKRNPLLLVLYLFYLTALDNFVSSLLGVKSSPPLPSLWKKSSKIKTEKLALVLLKCSGSETLSHIIQEQKQIRSLVEQDELQKEDSEEEGELEPERIPGEFETASQALGDEEVQRSLDLVHQAETKISGVIKRGEKLLEVFSSILPFLTEEEYTTFYEARNEVDSMIYFLQSKLDAGEAFDELTLEAAKEADLLFSQLEEIFSSLES